MDDPVTIAILVKLNEVRATCLAGEERNPDDDEWTIMRECYEDAIEIVKRVVDTSDKPVS